MRLKRKEKKREGKRGTEHLSGPEGKKKKIAACKTAYGRIWGKRRKGGGERESVTSLRSEKGGRGEKGNWAQKRQSGRRPLRACGSRGKRKEGRKTSRFLLAQLAIQRKEEKRDDDSCGLGT